MVMTDEEQAHTDAMLAFSGDQVTPHRMSLVYHAPRRQQINHDLNIQVTIYHAATSLASYTVLLESSIPCPNECRDGY